MLDTITSEIVEAKYIDQITKTIKIAKIAKIASLFDLNHL